MTYEQRCAQVCPGCAPNSTQSPGIHEHRGRVYWTAERWTDTPCAAPTRAEFEQEQAERIEALESALKPFVEWYERSSDFGMKALGDSCPLDVSLDRRAHEYEATVGDLRKAVDVLRKTEGNDTAPTLRLSHIPTVTESIPTAFCNRHKVSQSPVARFTPDELR